MEELSHLDASGAAYMVDVAHKLETERIAVAKGSILLQPSTLKLLKDGNIPKGDAFAAARIAGIMAAKRTSDLIPLCHPLPITKASLRFHFEEEGIVIEAEVHATGRTGVEMEAMTAVAIASLTLYDMVKAVDRQAVLTDIRLISKSGGKSGIFVRMEEENAADANNKST